MAYTVAYKPCADRDLKKLPQNVRPKIIVKIGSLADNPRPPDVKKLSGELHSLYRVRVGDYRVIYKIEDDKLVVLVVEIEHRKNSYR